MSIKKKPSKEGPKEEKNEFFILLFSQKNRREYRHLIEKLFALANTVGLEMTKERLSSTRPAWELEAISSWPKAKKRYGKIKKFNKNEAFTEVFEKRIFFFLEELKIRVRIMNLPKEKRSP